MSASACTSPGKADGGIGKPPTPKKKQGGGTREEPTAKILPTHATKGGQTPQPDGTEDWTSRAPEDQPAKHRQHPIGISAPPVEMTPRTRQHTPRWGKKKQKHTKAQPELEGRGDGHHETENRESQRPTPQSEYTTRHDAKQKHQGGGAGASTHAHTAHPKRERRNTGGAHTQPRTPQHLNQEWWDAGRNPSPTANTANPNQEKKGAPSTRTRTHPTKIPAKADGLTGTQTQAQPGPIHKRHTKIGNPVPAARALRQPVPCR